MFGAVFTFTEVTDALYEVLEMSKAVCVSHNFGSRKHTGPSVMYSQICKQAPLTFSRVRDDFWIIRE